MDLSLFLRDCGRTVFITSQERLLSAVRRSKELESERDVAVARSEELVGERNVARAERDTARRQLAAAEVR